MQQQLMQMQQPIMAGPFTANNITTDHIQQYLDENKSLILKILENQNTGKHGECADNQARLQRNLMYLAAIADSQPQPSSVYAQPGTNYLQQHQQSQQLVMATRSPILFAQQQHYSTLQQQQQCLHSHIGIGSALSSRDGENGSQSSAENQGFNTQRHSAGKGESL